jgi:uncharacterized protein (TIGR02246 family)
MKNPDYNYNHWESEINEREQEIELIRKLVDDVSGYKKDPEGFSQLFTPQAVIVNVAGIRVTGKDEIYKFMKQATESFLAHVSVKNEVVNITFLRSDVAVVSGIQHIFTEQEDLLEEDAKGSLTFVVVKEEGKWLIASGQNTIIEA